MRKQQPTTPRAAEKARLTQELAHQVLNWRSAKDRFLKQGGGWLPKWRFAPFKHLEDAFLLLDKVGGSYSLSKCGRGAFVAEVGVGGRVGRASGEPKAAAITFALARAVGIVDQLPTLMAESAGGKRR